MRENKNNLKKNGIKIFVFVLNETFKGKEEDRKVTPKENSSVQSKTFYFVTCGSSDKVLFQFCCSFHFQSNFYLILFLDRTNNRHFLRLNFLLVAHCLLLFVCCLFLVTLCSLLVARYFWLVSRCLLLITFYSLLATFCSLLFARYSLHFARLPVAYCEIMLLWTAKKWVGCNETLP